MRNTYLHYITVYPTVVPTLNPFKCITKIQLISPPPPLIKVDFKLEKEEISFSEEEGNRIYSHKWKEHSAPLKNQILEIAPSLQLCIPLLSPLYVSFPRVISIPTSIRSSLLFPLIDPLLPASFMQPFIFNELQDSIYLFPSLSSSHALLSRFSLLKSINKKKET